eukprot:CAMPEP_0174358482 /NCGR_PEP_ID=MMETSP0811_2-20130205/42941_1 /TAXON_ID=73025 ORGANISM="Eutreptiella gymnastica-like, Strain CCMP1594" /NCGR_SAMPLE_ID=MMETSP0811_2 /ASSEMBLY_ACC=CAM_ASM_000667 /LENGTH=57 /DNA_ID=CAMNT_0015492307 /DNA_START=747 /DNA_END=920 /DNA_ORIENTATION=+
MEQGGSFTKELRMLAACLMVFAQSWRLAVWVYGIVAVGAGVCTLERLWRPMSLHGPG